MTQQRNEQEAILVSMQEGVLALDPQAHVIAMNPAAEALLAVPAAQARGRTVQEVIRNVGLQRLLADAMSKAEPTAGEIVLRGDEERFLQGTATALPYAAGRDLGMLVVLNDIAQIHDGQVSVTSEVGKGSTFSLHLLPTGTAVGVMQD